MKVSYIKTQDNLLLFVVIIYLIHAKQKIGIFYGDYPHLPDVPVEQKDITYPYDNPEMRRNFGEVVCIKSFSSLVPRIITIITF